jgi:hypothetical protein
VAVETPPRDEVPGLLGRALRLADAGPRPFYRAALVSLAVTGLGTLVIASAIHPGRTLPGPQRHMIDAAVAAFAVSAALGILSLLADRRARPTRLDRAVDPQARAAIWLALAAWFPFLLIVAYYRARATFPPSVHWINFGFTDKRWITASYLLGALAPVLFLTAAARLLRTARGRPPTWRAWLAGLVRRGAATADAGPPQVTTDPAATADAVPPQVTTDAAATADAGTPQAAPDAAATAAAGYPENRTGLPWWRRALVVAAGVATALALAWYFVGPPWYLSQTTTNIHYQEDVWLISLQAIASGHLADTGVAGTQFGPGSQLACYWLMRHVTSFSVVGFRQAWSVLFWAGVSVLFVVFFLAFGYIRGLTISVLSALVYPALRENAFLPSGQFSGFWGWSNPLRYVGAIALVLLLPAAIRRCPSWRGVVGGVALGLVWGVMSYMGQENLLAGVIGALALSALLVLTGTAAGKAVAAGLAAVAAGFALVWLPILGFYAAHGDLGQYVHRYVQYPIAVAGGWSNTAWQGFSHLRSPLTTMYYAMPFVLAVIAVALVFEVRPLRIATRWSPERILLAVTVLTAILLDEGSLLRSDTPDLTGTMLAIPALVVVAATVLPRLLGGRRRATLIVAGAALAAASFALLPYSAYSWSGVRTTAEAPYLDREQQAARPRASQPTTIAARRVGGGLAEARTTCCQFGDESMASFIATMNRLHAIIGNRTTYVASTRNGYPGVIYFVADLTPAPVQYDKYTTVLNVPQLRAYMAYFRRYVLPRTQALVTTSLHAPEARYFVRRYPHARRITLSLENKPYYVLLAPGTRP